MEDIKEEEGPAITREDAELDALLDKLTPAEYVLLYIWVRVCCAGSDLLCAVVGKQTAGRSGKRK